VGAAYLLLTYVFYGEGVRNLASHHISDSGDGADFLWFYWEMPRAILHGHNPFASNLIFWPVGVRMAFHTTTPLEALLAVPLSAVFGNVLGINLLQIAAIPLTAVAAYLLALHQCGDRRIAFFAGAAFAFVPQHQGRMVGHWNLNHFEVLPFCLLALLRVYDRPTRWRAAVLGVAVGATFLTDLTFFVFFLGAAVLIAVWRWRESITRAIGVRLLQGGVVAGVISSPLVLAMLFDLRHHELDRLRGWGGAQENSADLLGWLTPSSLHPIWGGLTKGLHVNFGLEQFPYAGLLVLGLALFGIVRLRLGRTAPWPIIALVFGVLALGPFLHVNGWTGHAFHRFGSDFSVPLPYYVMHYLPVLSGIRIPGRFSIMAALALDITAAIALARLLRNRAPSWQWAVPVVVTAVTLVEFLPTPKLKLQSPDAPAAYAVVARDTSKGAVLEVPVFWRDGFGQIGDTRDDTITLYWATKHGHPIENGMVARLPEARRAALYAVPAFRQLLTLQHQVGFNEPPTFTAADLALLGFRFVAYHRSLPMPDVLAYVQTLHLPVLADDGETIIFGVPS
jgi:hypothetical protein